MIDREYRLVRCDSCIWQDFYEVGRRPSYPPRCPDCGEECQHSFVRSSFTATVRSLLGLDAGSRRAFGDPRAAYKNLRDRRSTRNMPVSRRV